MQIKEATAQAIADTGILDYERALSLLAEPPQPELGDLALPCFTLAKDLRRSPQQIAEEIRERLAPNPLYKEVTCQGPYLNFTFDPQTYVSHVLQRVAVEGENYGDSAEGSGKPVIVEFSSANIATPFHVGHGYSTILGQVIANLYEKLGYEVHRFNHLGDYGTQFGKLIYAWHHYGDEAALEARPIEEMLRIYIKFHEEAEKDPSLEDCARQEFKRLEAGDPDSVALWNRFRELSIVEFKRIYQRLNIDFDNWNGEAFYAEMTPEIVSELKEQGLLVESEGALVVDLEDCGLNPCIIIKSDGTSIYATRDLAAIKWRHEHIHFDKNIYVVGKEQSNHFQQLFAVLRKQGKDYADDCIHVANGRIKFADGDFSTRKGQIISLAEFLDRAVAKTKEIIENSPNRDEIEDIDQTAEIIGVDAVIFTYIKNSRERDFFFTWEEALSFEGETAPYLLYTYARARSILRKAGVSIDPRHTDFSRLDSAEDVQIAKVLDGLPEKLRQAAYAYEPSILVRQVLNLARSFNSYYHQNPILKAENIAVQEARLALVQIVADQLASFLGLLNLKTIEKM